MTDYLDLADYLLIAEAVTAVPEETLTRIPSLDLADSARHAPPAESGGVEFYPDFAMKAATTVIAVASSMMSEADLAERLRTHIFEN